MRHEGIFSKNNISCYKKAEIKMTNTSSGCASIFIEYCAPSIAVIHHQNKEKYNLRFLLLKFFWGVFFYSLSLSLFHFKYFFDAN